MSKYTDRVRAEFHDGSWAFVDPDNGKGRVKFDQAVMDATHLEEGVVVGYVKTVHGVDMEVVQWMSNAQKEVIGITSNHRFGIASYKRVRLLEDGRIERMVVSG